MLWVRHPFILSKLCRVALALDPLPESPDLERILLSFRVMDTARFGWLEFGIRSAGAPRTPNCRLRKAIVSNRWPNRYDLLLQMTLRVGWPLD